MKTLLNVQDIFEVPVKGVVGGGTNQIFDQLSATEIRNLISDNVEFQNPNGSTVQTEVVKVEFSNSLSGQKNIFLLLASDVEKNEIQKGAIAVNI